jgi:hypothetical protein
MHIYYLGAIIIFYYIKGNNNTKKKNQLQINFIMIMIINLHQNLIEVFNMTSNRDLKELKLIICMFINQILFKKFSHMNFFLHFIVIWNLMIQKGKWQPNKIKRYKDMIKSTTQHS